MFHDSPMEELFSASATVQRWLDVEAALAGAQSAIGMLSSADAGAIAEFCRVEYIDLEQLWSETRVVGYPIFPLVRQLAALVPDGPNGRIHLGATTQDIMDTALSIQMVQACDRLDALIAELGHPLADLTQEHQSTLMAARTHGQQAVPTTFGAKLGVHLAEFIRHRERISALRQRLRKVSLYGAGGTSAAMGPLAGAVRNELAQRLDLEVDDVPWHVARDSIAEFGFVCSAVAQSCARIAGEVIALSKTEMGELAEGQGHHGGASSTMPQKSNPIACEGIVAKAAVTCSAGSLLLKAMEVEHERAAGEWNIEWSAIPQAACGVAATVSTTTELISGLIVNPEAMNRNVELGRDGLIAEAVMMCLSPVLGREVAHDVVYEAIRSAGHSGRRLVDEVLALEPKASVVWEQLDQIRPGSYLGEAAHIAREAVGRWQQLSPPSN